MYLDNPSPDGLLAESELLALLGELLHLAPERHALADPQLRYLRDHLLARLDERHSLEDLAALFGLDRFAFLRQFKKKTGMTPTPGSSDCDSSKASACSAAACR